jgi:COG4 transport protein
MMLTIVCTLGSAASAQRNVPLFGGFGRHSCNTDVERARVQGAMMSSMLDDSFFVLKQACFRALSTGSMHCFVSTLSLVVSQVTGPVRDALARSLPPCPPSIVRLFADDATPRPEVVERVAAPLNNVVLCASFAAKMHSSLETEAAQRCGSVPWITCAVSSPKNRAACMFY